MDNSRYCHRLLFHEPVSNTSCSHFFGQWSYWGYTHAFTKLHTGVMGWISHALMSVDYAGVRGMSDSPGWMSPRSSIPKGGGTPPGVQWLPTKCLDTAYCKLILMSCDNFRLQQGVPWDLHLSGAYQTPLTLRLYTTRHTQPEKYGWVWWGQKLSYLLGMRNIPSLAGHWPVRLGHTKGEKVNLQRKCRDNFQDWGWNPLNIIVTVVSTSSTTEKTCMCLVWYALPIASLASSSVLTTLLYFAFILL